MSLLAAVLRKLNLIPVPLADTQLQMARARAVLEANRLGVFEALDAAPAGLTPQELGQRLSISPSGRPCC